MLAGEPPRGTERVLLLPDPVWIRCSASGLQSAAICRLANRNYIDAFHPAHIVPTPDRPGGAHARSWSFCPIGIDVPPCPGSDGGTSARATQHSRGQPAHGKLAAPLSSRFGEGERNSRRITVQWRLQSFGNAERAEVQQRIERGVRSYEQIVSSVTDSLLSLQPVSRHSSCPPEVYYVLLR